MSTFKHACGAGTTCKVSWQISFLFAVQRDDHRYDDDEDDADGDAEDHDAEDSIAFSADESSRKKHNGVYAACP